MSESESFNLEDLEQCSYRYLQGVAKSMKLPCNVKKIHLINMIFAKKYRPESELESIIKLVKEERLKASQNKVRLQPRRNLQGKEISSTSPQSPTPQIVIRCSPQLQQTLVKYNGQELPPVVQSQSPRRRSDRLLRSVTNKQNYKYMFNNTLIGVVKSQKTFKKAQSQKVALSQKTPMLKYVLNHLNTSILNSSNALIKKDFNELTIQKYIENKAHSTQIVQPNKRQRTLSGIYPLNPPINPPAIQPTTSYINIRGKDGKLTKINALIQRKNCMVKNYETNQNICVSVQDIINSNITAQVSNKYMIANSQSATNNDYPNMFRVTEPSALDKSSIRNMNQIRTNSDKTQNSLFIHNLMSQIPLKTSPNKPQHYYAHNNQINYNSELPSPITCCTTRRNQPLNLDKKIQARLETVINRPDVVKEPEINLSSRPETHTNIPDMHSIYTQIKKPNLSRTEVPIYNPEVTYYQPDYCYTQNHNLNQQYGNIDNAYTNQWVYNQNYYNTAPFSIDSSGEFYTYYHKKIRARHSISQRETENNANQEMLPRINKVFSRFNDMERDLTKPLYVQVSKESERIYNYPIFIGNNHSTHLLESIYNFKNSFITKEPVLRMVTTTSGTNCTYSTPIITTPFAQESSVAPSDMYASSVPVNPPAYTNSERPCLFDLLKAAEHESALQNDCRPSRTSSTSSATSSQANATIPEMDDAMEIISQDGDYMERITSDIMDDLRMQCFTCDWSGPRAMVEYHLRKEHGVEPESGMLLDSLPQPGDSIHYPVQWSQQTEDRI